MSEHFTSPSIYLKSGSETEVEVCSNSNPNSKVEKFNAIQVMQNVDEIRVLKVISVMSKYDL